MPRPLNHKLKNSAFSSSGAERFSTFLKMLMRYKRCFTVNLIAFLNELLYKDYNLRLWDIDF